MAEPPQKLTSPEPQTKSPGPPTGGQTTHPNERGTLDVRHKAIQHIVERVVLETPGTVANRSTLGRLVRSGSPRASITMEGKSARVQVDVAAVWPCHVTDIATGVRDHVLTEASRISGVHIRTVDVTIHMVDFHITDQPGRRRVQ